MTLDSIKGRGDTVKWKNKIFKSNILDLAILLDYSVMEYFNYHLLKNNSKCTFGLSFKCLDLNYENW